MLHHRVLGTLVSSVPYHAWHQQPGYYRDVTCHFPDDAKLLDIGCGIGWLANHFSDYTGIDYSVEALKRATALGRNVSLANVSDPLPYEDATFDGVVIKDLLEHVPDPVVVVREAARVLRPGGRAFASSPDAQRWVWDDYSHRRPFTRRSFRRLFEDNGYEVERLGYESAARITGIVSGWTRRKRRPRMLALAARLPIVRRNVWVLARRP
jgi:SAM-dependent methyltransferase